MYVTEKGLEALVERLLNNEEVSKIDRKNFKLFLNEAVAQQIGLLQRKNYYVRLSFLMKKSKKPLSEMRKEDVKELVAGIERNEKYQPVTKKNMKDIIKKYFQWLHGHEWNSKEFPDCVKWIKTGIRRRDIKLPEDILTKEDVLKLVDATVNTQDKTAIYTLYESGARLGEFLRLKIRDIVFDKYGAKIHITKGKTGSRVVRVIACASLLSQWINSHPLRDNRESPLWISSRMNPLDYRIFSRRLAKLRDKADIKKKVHPHAFRHARATHLASILTHAELCKFFGWTMSSDMPQIYIHMNGDTIDDKLLESHGMKHESKKEDSTKPVICHRCKHGNTPNSNYCFNCGLPMNDKVMCELDKEKDIVSGLIDKDKLSEMIKKMVVREMEKVTIK
ncbi:tyrosine-type recombinase/integrase [Candidatus Aenigmatarchaeota archaeon]